MGSAAAEIVAAASTPPVSLRLAGYSAEISMSPDIRAAALSLRSRAFRHGFRDEDEFDVGCLHGLVQSGRNQPRVAFRARLIHHPADLARCYTGQFYDLAPLQRHPGPYLEIGRFCQSDGPSDVMALRLAWAALGVVVDRNDVRLMIGCSSFAGADPDLHRAALAGLRARHLGPDTLRPKRLSPRAFDLPEASASAANLPHLLRSYMGMGGWVSDHAVQDTQLDTLHVFTGLSIDAIPAARKARLRAVARAAQADSADPLDLARAAP